MDLQLGAPLPMIAKLAGKLSIGLLNGSEVLTGPRLARGDLAVG
jgi:hypothetical protein